MQIDPLSDVLSLLRPHTYVAGGFNLAGRWSIGFEPHTGIKCYAVLSGACWLAVEGLDDPVLLGEGDCILLPNGRRFRLTSDPALEAIPFDELNEVEWLNGIATVGGGGDTLVLGGHFAFAGTHADVLLGSMPPVAHLRDDDGREAMRWSLDRMRQELVEAKPGSILVAQHLAHMLLVQALRLYLAEGNGRRVGWLFALADPKLASAIAAIHADPAARWTLPMLASKANMSRSSFARAFKSTVGTSPIEYVTRWRMLLAGARLSGSGEPVSVVARTLGYGSDAAFSTAFRRTMGCSPRQYARSRSIPEPAPAHPWAVTAAARQLG